MMRFHIFFYIKDDVLALLIVALNYLKIHAKKIMTLWVNIVRKAKINVKLMKNLIKCLVVGKLKFLCSNWKNTWKFFSLILIPLSIEFARFSLTLFSYKCFLSYLKNSTVTLSLHNSLVKSSVGKRVLCLFETSFENCELIMIKYFLMIIINVDSCGEL